MFYLKSNYNPAGDQPKAIKKLVNGLEKDYPFQTLLGVTGSGKTFTVSNIISNFKRPALVISPNKVLAAQLYREYKSFFPKNKVCYFVSYYDYYQPEAYIPSSDTYIGKEAMINQEIDRLRHETTSSLMSRKDVLVVASVSCIYNLGVPVNYFGSSIYLDTEKPITRNDLITQLIRIHFTRTNLDLDRGFFRVRGDIFEIRPASGEVIYKIILKNQKVKSIEVVNEVSKKIIEKLKEIFIFPPKHFISTAPEREKAIENIKEELKERVAYFKKQGKWLEAERLNKRTKNDIAMIKILGYCHGIENYSRHLTGKLSGESPDTLLSYFPWKNNKPDFITIIDESHIAVPQVRGMYEGDRARKKTLIEHGFRLPSALDNRPLRFDEFLKRISNVIFTSATPSVFEIKNSKQVVEQIIRPTYLVDPRVEVRPVFNKKTNKTQIDDLIEEIKKSKERVIINALTKKMAEELSQFLKNKKIKSEYMHSDTKTLDRAEILTNFRKGNFDVLVGVNLLREGLDLPEVGLVAILDADREGFLRNKTSLIQLMGRAARNVKGKVIVYADSVTGSIKEGLEETDRRRKIQLDFNKKHNLKPKTIKKEIISLIDINEKR